MSMVVRREWCCKTPVAGPHAPGCAFEPIEENAIDYTGPVQVGGAVEHPTDVVHRAKAALEGVRPGPWQVVGYGNVTAPAHGNIRVGKVIPAVDAHFVAEARSLVPELIAEVERLRGLNEALKIGQGNLQVLLSDAQSCTDNPCRNPAHWELRR